MAEVFRADIVGRDMGASRTMRDFAVSTDVAAESARRFADAEQAANRAKLESAAATIAAAKADKILKDSQDEAIAATVKQRMETDKLKASAKEAAGKNGIAALAGGGGVAGGGMGALIAAGVALAPVLVTVGAGLGGLSLAALAAGKNSKQLKAELDPLKDKFAAFGKSVQPVLLTDFAAAARLAGHVLTDIRPVTIATGKALAGFLGQFGQTLQSAEFRQFWQFMGTTASTDIQLLGQNVIDLTKALPPLLEDLQPLATGLLHVSDDAVKAAGGIVRFYNSFQKNVPVSNEHTSNFLKDLDRDVVSLTNHIPGAKAVNDWLTGLQHSLTGTGTAAGTAAAKVHQAATALAQTSHAAYLTISPLDHLGKVADTVAGKQDNFALSSQKMRDWLKLVAKELNVEAAQFEHALTPLENYINATLTQRDDLASLNQTLKASGDRIGYKTQKERDSFAATQTFIDQTIKTGNAALAAHKGIQGQIDVIDKAIPRLEAVKGKTAAYKQELDLLKGILDKLRQEKLIQEQIKVFGSGNWHVAGAPHGVPGIGGKLPAAAGALITGGVPGRDSVPVMAMPGELIVPTKMVAAGLVDHLRGSIPGFASGGIVPSYKGGVAGLPPWTSHNQLATVTTLTTAIAKALVSSLASSAGGGFGMAGPGGGAPAANAALARRMMPAWASGAEWAAWNYVAMRESGWNQFAYNPSGAFGIPQALPYTKMPHAAWPVWAGGQANPMAQIGWMIGYIRSTYGDPVGAAAHERSHNWYGDGLRGGIFTRPTMIGVGERGPERVDVTPLGRGQGRPVVQFGDVNIYDATDVALVQQRLSFAIAAAGLGS